jgi:hypothetical protein
MQPPNEPRLLLPGRSPQPAPRLAEAASRAALRDGADPAWSVSKKKKKEELRWGARVRHMLRDDCQWFSGVLEDEDEDEGEDEL